MTLKILNNIEKSSKVLKNIPTYYLIKYVNKSMIALGFELKHSKTLKASNILKKFKYSKKEKL